MTTASLSLYHRIRPSSITDNRPIPVLFMLHGYGSDENDLFSFSPELPQELCIISIRAPYPMQPYGNAWYAINFDAEQGKWSDEVQARNSRDKIVAFIDEACGTYHLDHTNISLLGFSQGAILSYAVALSFPEKIKNVIALSGYINADIFVEDYQSKKHEKLDIYTSHGSVDEVIPVNWAQRTPSFLESLNVKHQYEEFPIGHGVSQQNFYSFQQWLAARL